MGRRKKPIQSKQAQLSEPIVWLKAEIEFGTTFSYRQPDASAQFAIGSPVPSPAAIKLALVDTAIRWNKDVDYGRQVFEWLKTCKACPVPPERVIRFRVFLKRLKPRGQKLLESTGIRDYFLLDGPLTVFLQVPQSKVDEAKDLLCRLRKLGTSDSLCWCAEVWEVNREQVPQKLFPCKLGDVPPNILQQALIQGLMVVRLSDLTEKSTFDDFNPFNGRQAKLEKSPYLLPLKLERYGETWALLVRTDLEFIGERLNGG